MAYLTPHFDSSEYQRKSNRTLTTSDIANARALSEKAELIRAALGGYALIVTSFVRTQSSGQHGNGTAADYEPIGHSMTPREVVDKAMAIADKLAPFGQLIFYPHSDQHIHLSLQTGIRRNEILVANAAEDIYESPTPSVLAQIPGSVVASILVLVILSAVAIYMVNQSA